MSICLLPTSTAFPSIHFCDDLFEEINQIEKALRPLRALVPNKHDRSETVEKVTDDESKLSLTLDVSKFKPEELKVDLDGRTLTIEGKQEAKDEQSYSMRSFIRRWVLPENTDVDKIHSSMTSEEKLVIEVPKVVKPAATTRSIPIMKAQEQKQPVKSN